CTFFFNATPTTVLYTLSLHDALPIFLASNPRIDAPVKLDLRLIEADQVTTPDLSALDEHSVDGIVFDSFGNPVEYHVLRAHPGRSEEHTSELQSREKLVCRLLLEKKK